MQRTIRLAIVVCLAGSVLLLLAGAAAAQEIEGGCSAEVNGRSPSSLTEDEPLVLDDKKQVRAAGSAPAGAQEGQTNTDLRVIVFGLPVPFESSEGEGVEWGGNAEIPGYLKTLSPGVYRVEADGSGPGWECTASGYIELDGGPWTVAAGLGAVLAGLGVAMVLGSRGAGADADRGAIARKTGSDARGAGVVPDRMRTALADLAYLVILALLFYLAYDVLDLAESLAAALPAAAGSRRVWVRGRVVRGFFGGLVLGLGAAIVLHQFDVWVLDLTQGLAFPVAVAVASTLRAGIGSAYRASPPATPMRESVPEPVGVGPASAAAEPPAPRDAPS